MRRTDGMKHDNSASNILQCNDGRPGRIQLSNLTKKMEFLKSPFSS